MKTLTLLTPRMLSRIKPKPKEFSLYDAQCEGLALRVQSSGVRSRVFWDRVDGKTRKITLGKYPDMTLEAARQSMHALLIVAVSTVQFLAIHPFQDGNGRLSRVLTTLMLLRAGYAYTSCFDPFIYGRGSTIRKSC